MRHFRFFYILFFGAILFFLPPFHFTDSFAENKDSLKKDDPKKIINIMERELTRSMEKLKLKSSPTEVASALEFVLEGLHINRKLNKDRLQGRTYYRL